MTLTVQQIFERYFDGFAARRPLSDDMRYAAMRLRGCRTAALGGHVIGCPSGHVARIAYNSCRHRSCPQCSLVPREAWLHQWRQRLLDCPHFHAIFTTPHELLPLWRYNKREFAAALFAAASRSLLELLDDDKYLGARVGLLAALHTWSQTLAEHVHLHVLVTAGGLTAAGGWRAAKKSCLLPRKVLMLVFRGKLREELLRRLERGQLALPPDTSAAQLRSLLNRLGRQVWNVKLLERYQHGQGVATYLACYLKGGPISNRRLLAIRAGRVHFRCRASDRGPEQRQRGPTTSLAVDDFLARLLEHVPPRGMQTVRGYGLYVSHGHECLNAARRALGHAPLLRPLPPPPSWQELLQRAGHGESACCPVCGTKLVCHSHFGRGRAPPWPLEMLPERAGGTAA